MHTGSPQAQSDRFPRHFRRPAPRPLPERASAAAAAAAAVALLAVPVLVDTATGPVMLCLWLRLGHVPPVGFFSLNPPELAGQVDISERLYARRFP